MGPRMHKDVVLVAIRGVDKISFEVLSNFIFLRFSKHLEIYYLDIILVFSIIYTIIYFTNVYIKKQLYFKNN